MNSAQAYKTQWQDSFVSIEHLLVALAKDTRCGKEYDNLDNSRAAK